MRDAWYFLLRFLRHPVRVAAVAPSSRALAHALAGDLGLAEDDLVIELGPGTGAVTQAIARIIDSGTRIRYLGIEKDPGLCRFLERRFPGLDFVCDDAERLAEIVDARGLGRARAIVSGVPLILMNENTLRLVLRSVYACLEDGGEFRAVSYLHSYPRAGARLLRGMIRIQFGELQIRRIVWWNLPPGLALCARRLAAAEPTVESRAGSGTVVVDSTPAGSVV